MSRQSARKVKAAAARGSAAAPAVRQPIAAARTGAALTGSAVLLGLAVATVLPLIVPVRATRTERSL
ncbi:hypothetical protein AB0D35_09965 [Streptomyces sp. NPDC048301]|uniref:hypothetical protein n=1 Tax=unclassified Streptomyces TaxID=2593676 RepID=UPI003417A146